jgi:outer membrane immunogenic protein
MKKSVTVAALAASVLAAGAAKAADLPRTSAPPPVVQALPIFTWTGFYVGINGGYVFETGKSRVNGLAASDGLKTLGEGYTIGVTAGYNQQFGNFVAGIEGDINYVDLGKTVTAIGGGFGATVTQNTSYLATIRGRLGVAFDRALVYGTGGLAMGDHYAATAVSGFGFGWDGIKDNDIRFGYTVGAGLEYAITNNLSAKIEYLYYDLGKHDYASTQVSGPVAVGGFTTRAENKGNLVRAGINYRF